MTSRNLNRTPTQKMKKFVFNSEKCIYILSTWHLCCFASFAQPVFCFVCFFLIFFWVTCQLTWLYQPIVTNIWFKSEWTWKIRNDIKTTVVMEELYWKFSWWEIFGWLDSLYFTKRLNHLLLTEVFFFVFFFALHGGNKPPYSCESGCRPASVLRMNSEWCYWLWTKKAKRFVMNSALPTTTKIFTLFIKALHKEALILFCLCLVSLCIIPFFFFFF